MNFFSFLTENRVLKPLKMCPTRVLKFWPSNHIWTAQIASKITAYLLILIGITISHWISHQIEFQSLISAKDLQFSFRFNVIHRIGRWICFGPLDGAQKILLYLVFLPTMNHSYSISLKIAWDHRIVQMMWATIA